MVRIVMEPTWMSEFTRHPFSDVFTVNQNYIYHEKVPLRDKILFVPHKTQRFGALFLSLAPLNPLNFTTTKIIFVNEHTLHYPLV